LNPSLQFTVYSTPASDEQKDGVKIFKFVTPSISSTVRRHEYTNQPIFQIVALRYKYNIIAGKFSIFGVSGPINKRILPNHLHG
jgi:hypothetical protein